MVCLSHTFPAISNDLRKALSSAFVEEAVKIIVTRLLPLNVQDLQAWMADPEEWVNAEDKENDQWEYELRVSLYIY